MWTLILCGRRNSFRASKGVFEPSRRIFTCYATFQQTFQWTSRTPWMLRSYMHFEQLEDALDAIFQQPFPTTARTLWMLRCTCAMLLRPFRATSKMLWMRCSNSHFKQLPGHYGCKVGTVISSIQSYVPTAISINFPATMDATVER